MPNDTAELGEPPGVHYASQQQFHALGHRPVWLEVNGHDGWTAMFPEDR